MIYIDIDIICVKHQNQGWLEYIEAAVFGGLNDPTNHVQSGWWAIGST